MRGSTEGGDTAPSAGGIHVFYGPLLGEYARGDESQLVEGNRPYDALGWDIVGLGDVDGDGLADFAVGASDSGGARWSGTPAVYRVEGPADIASIGHAVALVQDSTHYGCLGSSMASSPDRDGDGAAELLVADRCIGQVHLLSGGSDDVQSAGTDDLATFVDPTGERRFGHDLAVGDFDGDGRADTAVGGPDYDIATELVYDLTGLGYVAMFADPVGGLVVDSDADTVAQATESDTLPSHISGKAQLFFGASVAAGDLNGDGYDDLVVGATERNDATADEEIEGATFVFFGPLPSTLRVTDADYALTGGSRDHHVGGETSADTDLNGDGQSDLLVGSGFLRVDAGLISERGGYNASWLVFGPLETGAHFASDADVRVGDSEEGLVSDWRWGSQTAVVGDTNGDDRLEFMVAGGASGSWIGLFGVPTGSI